MFKRHAEFIERHAWAFVAEVLTIAWAIIGAGIAAEVIIIAR